MLKISQEERQRLIKASHHAPRSVLGFHEISDENQNKIWVIRVFEPDAQQVYLSWEESQVQEQELEQIDPDGLFQLQMPRQASLSPYLLRVVYKNGHECTKHDPYYFAPELSEFDLHLFGEGNHHHIYHKLGAHLMTQQNVKGVRFAVWAPSAKRVSVVGDFNYWDGRKHAMQSLGSSGVWELFIPNVKEGDLYKYEILSQSHEIHIKTDPYGFYSQIRPDTASRVANLDSYQWNDQDWQKDVRDKKQISEPINIYEVHLGSWKLVLHEGNRFLTYREMATELIPYVQDMGYTHIELLGILEYPFDGSWGYQVTGYYAPTSRYGSPQDFMFLIDACHQANLGVIIDWIPAHFPKDSHGLSLFDGTCLYEHSDPLQGEHRDWGTKIFNYGRNEVRNFLISSALFWFDKYHVDGLRVDAVASMIYLDYSREDGQWIPNCYGGKENLEALHFLRSMNEVLFHYYPGALSIAEESTAFHGVSHPTYVGGLGFNFKWNMGWMNDSLQYISKDSIYRGYDNHLITFSMIYAYSENYILPISHDEVVHGKGSLLSKMPGDEWQKRANHRLYLSFKMAHPGKKLLFMGSEFGQWEEWHEWSSLDWHLVESFETHQQLQSFCKTLNWFYRNHESLYSSDTQPEGFEWIDHHDHNNSVYSFARKSLDGQKSPIIFIFNFTPVPRDNYRIGVPDAGLYQKLIDSDAHQFGGSGYNQQPTLHTDSIASHWRNQSLSLNLPPLGAMAFQLQTL